MAIDHDLLKRITARPDVFGGKPIIRDMRVSVELILSLLTQGVEPKEILEDYPDLELDDIRACILTLANAILNSYGSCGSLQRSDFAERL